MSEATLSQSKSRERRPAPKAQRRAPATIRSREGSIHITSLAAAELMEAVRKGLPFREVEKLQADLQLPLDALAARLGLARATLHRRKIAGRLTSEESEKVVRFARIFRQAVDTLGGPEDARAWLSASQVGLGGAIPLEYVRTELGVREVEHLLGRIEHGVYS